MKTQDYVEIINKTKVYPSSVDDFGIAYAYLGIIDESGEVMFVMENGYANDGMDREALMKEIGDVIWYVTALCIEIGVDTIAVLEAPRCTYGDDCNIVIEVLAGFIKKYYRDGKPFDLDAVTTILQHFVGGSKEVLAQEGISWEETLEANYDKLIKRRETNTLHGDGDYREKETA